jgi:hypothetical protein
VLTSELELIRLSMCVELLLKVRGCVHNNWRNLITGEESWFYYEYVRDRIWAARDDNTPEVEKMTIPSRKSMSTVVWNPHGFHLMTTWYAACGSVIRLTMVYRSEFNLFG